MVPSPSTAKVTHIVHSKITQLCVIVGLAKSVLERVNTHVGRRTLTGVLWGEGREEVMSKRSGGMCVFECAPLVMQSF